MCTFIGALKLFAAFTFDDMKKRKNFLVKTAFSHPIIKPPCL